MKVLEIPLTEILVKDRVRTEIGGTQDIEETIKTSIGQIQTIAVKELEQPDNEHKYKLLAGGRRYIAFEKVGYKTIFAHVYPSTLTEEEELAIELVENLARHDIRWDEHVEGVLNLHELLIKKGNLNGEEWSIVETAQMLGQSETVIRRDINLAKSIKLIPELRKAKNKSEALNAEARLIEDIALAEKARRAKEKIADSATIDEEQETEPSSDKPEAEPESKKAIIVQKKRKLAIDSYIHSDLFTLLPDIPDGQFDIVEFDPDYGIENVSTAFSSRDNRLVKDIITKDYQFVERDESSYSFYINKSIKELKRVMKPDSWLLIWFSLQDRYELICSSLMEHGFKFSRRPAIWYKDVIGKASLSPEIYLGATYETFIYARLGDARISDRGHGDVFAHKTVHNKVRLHPTEKPIGLMQEIFYVFGQPNQRVFIPHAGSGNSIKAALNLNMHPLGCDISQETRDKFIISCERWEPLTL